MEEKFHINKEGNIAKCNASIRRCPFGGDESHYSSYAEAEDARNREYEKEFNIVNFFFKNDNIKDEEEAKIIADSLKTQVEKISEDQIRDDRHGLHDFVNSIDVHYVLYSSNSHRLREDALRKINITSNATSKAHSKNRELTSRAVDNFYQIEEEENKRIKKLIEKDVTEVIDTSTSTSISTGLSFLKSVFSISSKADAKVQRVEKEKKGLGKLDLKANERIKAKNDEIEKAKERAIEDSVAPYLEKRNKNVNKINNFIDNELKTRAEHISNVDNKNKAFEHIEDIKDLQSKVYIAREGEMELSHRFREAEESGDQVLMRSCNRLVNLFSNEDKKIGNLTNERVNTMAFEENYERLKSGEIFNTKSLDEYENELSGLYRDLAHCFDTYI